MLEAMAAQCLIIASDTPPVTEVIEDGHNGLLVDYFSPENIAARVEQVLARPDDYEEMRVAARQTILDRYALSRQVPKQCKLVEAVAARAVPYSFDSNAAP